MPEMDGKEASKRILSHVQKAIQDGEEEELTHIVALTSFTNEKNIEECLSIGIKKVYNKPLKL